MKQRQIYYSRKAKGIVIEGKRGNKTIYLYRLPPPEKLLESLNIPSEKYLKILQKIQSLNIINKTNKKTKQKVRSLNIVRTPKNSDDELNIDEHIKSFKEKE